MGIALLKRVSGQNPREIALQVLGRWGQGRPQERARSPKSEIRNPKSETNPKFKAERLQTSPVEQSGRFEHFNFPEFEFVSDFGFRISDLRRAPYIEELFENTLSHTPLKTVDRHLCHELVYGVVRWQATLDWLIGRKTQNRTQKPALQDLLRLGLYQIFWLERIPNHAAVHESVELAKRRGLGPQAGFVNAVLRGYLREFEATKQLLAGLKAGQPWLGFSHPEWLAARWQSRWGAEAAAQLMAWNNTPPQTFARVNTLKTEQGALLAQWREENVEYDFVRRDWVPENLVFELKAFPPLARLPSFQQGLFYVQDPSTLLAVRELAPEPGEAVLDLCAAPGGKLTYIAQLMRNEGRLAAYDVSADRLRLLEANCARLGVRVSGQWSIVSSEKSPKSAHSAPRPTDHGPLTTDYGLRTTDHGPLTPDSGPPPPFNKILVDAPCSNTGVMRRRVDLRWRIRPDEIERLRAEQLQLLRKSATLLKPGGLLVYSTCSLEPEENEQVVREFLSGASDFKLETERRLRPFADAADGAYVTRLRRQT